MPDPYRPLAERFGDALKRDEPLSRYTVARLGGPADALLTVHSAADLADAAKLAHEAGVPWVVLGGGANVLVADAGFRGLVIVNRADAVQIEADGRVTAESGASFSTLARKCIAAGLAGLEWAVSIPGTVGGAAINNAGAHGGDMAAVLRWVELLNLDERPHIEVWSNARMRYGYRRSALKGTHGQYVLLRVTLRLEAGHDPEQLSARADEFVAHRKRTQPPGASLGSIFKNPPDDYAGRLIEAAGLKGKSLGGVQISPVHANFILNAGDGTARDYRRLMELAQRTVREKFGVTLEPEIELLGDWDAEETPEAE